MTIYQFLGLDEMEQAEAIWEATLAGSREDAEYRILLYRIDGFYVEVFYHKEHNVIKKIRPFDDQQELEPYLDVSSN